VKPECEFFIMHASCGQLGPRRDAENFTLKLKIAYHFRTTVEYPISSLVVRLFKLHLPLHFLPVETVWGIDLIYETRHSFTAAPVGRCGHFIPRIMIVGARRRSRY